MVLGLELERAGEYFSFKAWVERCVDLGGEGGC